MSRIPLRIFLAAEFSIGSYYSKKSYFFLTLIILKKIRLRRALIIRAKGAFSVGVEIGRSSRKECPLTMSVRVP